jgi:uncharacterized membrane protein
MNVYGVLFSLHELFSWFGIIIISAGVFKAVVLLIKQVMAKKDSSSAYYQARMTLCQSIVFGLEFMVAADVVKTMLVPDQKNIILLGGLVLIRTFLSYALSMELAQLKKESKK